MSSAKVLEFLFLLGILSGWSFVFVSLQKAQTRKLSVVFCDSPLVENAVVKLLNTGEIAPKKLPAGTKIVLVCREGFYMKGANHSVCLRRGKWLHVFGKCLPTDGPKKCPIPWIANGEIQTPLGIEILDSHVASGTAIVLKCRPGFFIQGMDNSRCLEVGVWDVPLGLCIPVPEDEISTTTTLPPPLFVHNTVPLAFESQNERSYVEAEASSSKRASGASENLPGLVEIGNDGFPRCTFKRIACILPMEVHGTFLADGKIVQTTDLVLPNTEVVLQCFEGFSANRMDHSLCTEVGEWSNRFGRCKRICGKLPKVENGFFLETGEHNNGLGVQQSLECNNGYSLRGPDNVICLANGTWSLPGKCVKHCKETPKIPNGFVALGDDVIGAKRRIGCDPGFIMLSNQTITCLESGKWSVPETASCLEIDMCGSRPPVDNGFYEEDEERIFRLGSVQKIRCNTGLEMFGPDKVTCDGPGSWTLPGQCLPGCAGGFPSVNNGFIERHAVPAKSGVVKVSCNPGHEIYGPSSIYCDEVTQEYSKPGICLEECNRQNVWPRPAGLVAFWPLDERSRLLDVGPNGFNIDFDTQNALLTSDVDGPFSGKCYTVLNDNSHIGFRGFLNEARSFTISFYFLTTGVENAPILMFYYEYPRLSLSYIAPSFLEIRTGNGMPLGDVVAIFEVFKPDRWNFVALVYDRELGEISVHGKNGIIIKPTELGQSTLSGWSLQDWFYIGKAPNNTSIAGMKKSEALACMMIYNVPLAEFEIVQLQRACRCQRR